MTGVTKRQRPRRALVWGMLGGVLATMIVDSIMAMMQGDRFWSHLFSTPWLARPRLWVLMGGAFIGYLTIGSAVGNRRAQTISHGSSRLLLAALGALMGAAAGAAAYALFWLAHMPQATLPQAFARLPRAVNATSEPAGAFLVAGALAGLSVALYAVGGDLFRRFTRSLTGASVGAIAGLVVYTVGYVALYYPGLPESGAYVFHFAEAIYSFTPVEFLFVTMGCAVGIILSRYAWRLYGMITIVSLFCVVLGYLAYSLTVTLPNVPPSGRAFSWFLFTMEAISLSLVLLYSFYTIDVATRKHWRRTPRDAAFSKYYMPKVCIQVPCFNEPPELVKATIEALTQLDYPVDRYHVMVLDDSTKDECAAPLQAYCDAAQRSGLPVHYYHRSDRTGYKAGALNFALRYTPEDANLIAVVDADYVVEPNFLRETVGFFIDPRLGWLQTPQDYRNRGQSFLTEQYYLADAYFYRTILPSRNEENSIIFCGTMGMLRKTALVQVGGWGEKYITEDAELSVRLSSAGWRSLYVNKTYGRGLIPATFDGYKRQQYRWAFGGGKIFRGHFWDLLLGRFTARQRFDYLVGAINWFEGIFLFLIAMAVATLAIGELAGQPVATQHSNEVLLMGLVPFVLLVDGLTRVHLVLRRSMKLSFGGTLRVLGMWMSVKFSNMRAAMKAFIGFNIPFARTPKAPGGRPTRSESLRHALRLTRFESVFCAFFLFLAAGIAVRTLFIDEPTEFGPTFTRALLILWLAYYCFVFGCAPVYAYKSYATFKPEAPAPVSVKSPVGVAQ